MKDYKNTETLLTKSDLKINGTLLDEDFKVIEALSNTEYNLIQEVQIIKYKSHNSKRLFNSKLDLMLDIKAQNILNYCLEIVGGEGSIEFKNGVGWYEFPIEMYERIYKIACKFKEEIDSLNNIDNECSIFDIKYQQIEEISPLRYLLKCMFIKNNKCIRVGQIYFVEHFDEIQGGVLND